MVKFFLDTADVACLAHWEKTGLIHGVTTNPSNLKKASGDPRQTVKKIIELFQNRDVSVQVTETEPKKVYEQALRIKNLGSNVVVKIPCSIDFFPIIERLSREKTRLNITLVFSPLQATIMANFGVTYVSPFIGRLEDDNQDGILLIAHIKEIYDLHGYKTEILGASLRTVAHAQDAILAGATVVTVPPLLCEQMVNNHLTDQGITQFLCDWNSINVDQFP
jgi:transaldolase